MIHCNIYYIETALGTYPRKDFSVVDDEIVEIHEIYEMVEIHEIQEIFAMMK